jgi:predicted ATP-dependent endonuclease of OLD family
MRISRFHIKNYKSLLASGNTDLDLGITVLTGKNESGKTCILKALESFRTDYRYGEDDLCLYSEARERIHLGETKGDDIEIIKVWFDLEDEDRDRLVTIEPKSEDANTLVATKYFDGSYRIEIPSVGFKKVGVHNKTGADKNTADIVKKSAEFKQKLDDHAARYEPFSDARTEYESIIDNMLSLQEGEDSNLEDALSEAFNRLRDLGGMDSEIRNDIDGFIQEVELLRHNTGESYSVDQELVDDMLAVFPNIVYFSDIEQLEDGLPVDEFLTHREKHKTLSNLIELSGLDVERVKDAEDYAMLSDLRSASTTVSGLVNQSWTQEDVRVNTALVRDRIVISIYDDVIGRDHPPSVRSQGFRWFLSFYITFMAGSHGEFKNTIILLDDLGIYLHPSGQKDLLKTLESISRSNQIVYVTNCPYMIDRDKLTRVRLVSKKKGKGTVIRSRVEKRQPVSSSDVVE